MKAIELPLAKAYTGQHRWCTRGVIVAKYEPTSTYNLLSPLSVTKKEINFQAKTRAIMVSTSYLYVPDSVLGIHLIVLVQCTLITGNQNALLS